MTNPVTQPPVVSTARTPGWVKVVLSLSLALNLLVAGLALGAWLGDGPGKGRGPRDLSFGIFTEALNRDDRRALRLAFEAQMPDMRQEREAARADVAALLAALRAEPWDEAALTEALKSVEDRLTGRMELGRSLLEEHILAMPPKERAAFANRLEQVLRRADGD